MRISVLMRVSLISILIIYVLGFFYIFPVNVFASEELPVNISGWMYREGDSPKNDNNVPVWILEKDSAGWQDTKIDNSSNGFNISGSILKTSTVWYKMRLPLVKSQNPTIYFESIVGQSMEMYLDARKIYELKRTPWTVSNKQVIPLGKDYYGKTLYIKVTIPELYKPYIGPTGQVLLGDFQYLLSVYIKNGFAEICFGVIFIFFSGILIFSSLFLAKEQKRKWISLGLLTLNTGIMVMLNNIDFNMFFGNISQFERVVIESSMMFLFAIVRFTFTNLLIYFFIQIFDSNYNLKFIKKILKIQNIYSVLCFILLLAFILSGYKFTEVYGVFTYSILALLYFFEFIVLIITIVSYAIKKDINARIFLFGFFCFILTFTIFFVIVILYNATCSSILWMVGVLIFVFSLITILARGVAEVHFRVIKYSADLEISKNQLADLNKTLEIRIEQRTEELEMANERLTAVNEELNASNDELSLTMNTLRETQAHLIQSAKMAALGQLATGIAHEINTPLGIIQASIGNITDYLDETMIRASRLFKMFDDNELSQFNKMLERALKSVGNISSKEERKLKKVLSDELERNDIKDWHFIADTLVDMGIYDDIDLFLPLLKCSENSFIVKTAYNLSGLQRNAKNIKIAIERASKIVFALKTYAHNDITGEPVLSDIREGVDSILTLYYNQIKRSMDVIRNYSDIPKIMCYPDELNQVWINIIYNSFQAMDFKGIMQIDIFEEINFIVVNITDNGKGIPDDIKDRIFEPFFTTKSAGEGTGLGLDIVKKIVAKHKGYISFESIPGKTTVTVKLPTNLCRD